MAKLNTAILGACGEHYVAFYLSGMGNIVTLTKPGTPKTDMHVNGTSFSVQVKTGQGYNHVIRKKSPEDNWWVWRVGKKAMNRAKESHWYAFVAIEGWLQEKGPPEVFFVSSKSVAKRTRENEKLYKEGEWFSMSEEEARLCRGTIGYQNLKKALP